MALKVLSSADWHILLHKKKVPYEWQENRFKLMFKKLHELESSCDIHIIAGDVFDKKPEPDEICLFLSYINSVSIPTYIIPGNHEATKKGETFLQHFLEDAVITNPLVKLFTKNDRLKDESWPFGIQFFPYGEMQIGNVPEYVSGDILVTHIRGEVPPHVTPEFDFEKLRPWKLTLLGDLHFNHKYKDFDIYYPGSPINTHFDREDKRQYGVDIFTVIDDANYTREFIDLKLPKLIRKTVSKQEDIIPHDYNHVIYEITGSIDEVSKIENSELIDKKIATAPSENSKIDLRNKSLIEELEEYLKYLKVDNIESILDEYKGLGLK
jgi:DNA repair exonuclease SbcCD nuclease subunit